MAFAMIDDLTGDHHPVEQAHRLTLHLDRGLVADGDTSEIAGWDVASTDPRELLAQLGEHLSGVGEHLSGVTAPLRPVGPLPGVESLRLALKGVRGGPPRGTDEPTSDEPAEDVLAEDVPEQDLDGYREGDVDLAEPTGAALAAHREDPAPVPVPDARRATAPERVAEAVGGEATDAVVRAWAARYQVPCSMTGKLNGWARRAYVRTRGGPPDAEMWRDAGIPTETSSSARPGDETPAAARPVPPAGRAAAGTTTPDRAGRGPDPAPAPGGEAGAGAGTSGRARPEQLDLAEELAADGATPMTIVNRTGISLEKARELVAQAKEPRR